MKILAQIHQSIPGPVKPPIDALAILGWVAALAGVLTPIIGLFAALASLAWSIVRLLETKTVQKWINKKMMG